MAKKADITKPNLAGDEISAANYWAALQRRDKNFEGVFVYAVTSTGVYCRPACPAKLPKRGNVRFFDTAAEARRAGFRACLRCRPDDSPLQTEHAALIAKACRLIERAEVPPRLDELAKATGLSVYYFHRLFKSATGLTPKAYTQARRAYRLRMTLSKEGASVTNALYDAGFNSSGRFYSSSNTLLGMKPRRFRSGGSGMRITYATGSCSLGVILVAASEKGICAILLGDERRELVEDLQARFAKAEIAEDGRGFQKTLGQVITFVDRPAVRFDLPLDIQGTAFQARVWQALRKIPPGTTVSYRELAKRLNLSGSARAVAQAVAANPLAVVVPCHRVIRSDGSLSGYRWGVERKRILLDKEGVSTRSD
jgi:AraC family transcriptional regulator of adaptative response/methylated-DNA-[protein]-cysteine methyltransferase